MRFRGCFIGFAWATLVALSAHGQTAEVRPAVRLTVDPCVGADRAEVERIAAIELRPSTVVLTSDASASVSVAVDCHERGVRVRVDDSITRKIVERVVSVSDVDPRARARWVAIAVAELVRASWSELDDETPLRVEPARSTPPIELVRAAQRAVTRAVATRAPDARHRVRPANSLAVWGSVSGGVRAVSASYGAQLLGLVAADCGVRWTPWLQTRVGLVYLDGSRVVSEGGVRASVFEARASLHVAMRRGLLGLAIGAGFAAGPALYAPRASNPLEAVERSAVVAWGGSFVDADVSVTIVRSWLHVVALVEGGVVAFASSANVVTALPGSPREVRSAFALEGFWGSATVGLRVGAL